MDKGVYNQELTISVSSISLKTHSERNSNGIHNEPQKDEKQTKTTPKSFETEEAPIDKYIHLFFFAFLKIS